MTLKYTELEAEQQRNDEEWEHWKRQWEMEKKYYLHRIKDLEEMVGFGEKKSKEGGNFSDHKDFLRRKALEHRRSISKEE